VYDPDKYWLGPTWMASTKPVIDVVFRWVLEMWVLEMWVMEMIRGVKPS